MNQIKEISNAFENGRFDEAMHKISYAKQEQKPTAEIYYWEGRIHMKRSNWGAAMSCFLKAEALNTESPAREYRLMLCDIMDFYNKDMYNQ